MSKPTAIIDPDDLQVLAAEQRREIMAAEALDADQDLAFDLQLQEAISASLSLHSLPSTSATVEPKLTKRVEGPSHIDLLSEEVRKLEQELQDRAISEVAFKKMKSDIHLRLHDYRVALEVSRMPDGEWQDWGDNFERPFGASSSKGVSEENFRVYFKGLMEKRSPNGVPLGGIGVAICDSRDELLFELRKPMTGSMMNMNGTMAEMRAVIEALTAALDLDLKRVILICDSYPVFKYATFRWSAKQRKLFDLVSQVAHLESEFTSYQPILVPRNEIKFAFKLAREAIDSQLTRDAESIGAVETCAICLEEVNVDQIFSVENCLHRYCFSCIKQHVEVKLLHGSLPTCPHENCKSELRGDSCSKFLTPKLMNIMNQRVQESLIPATEKVYCPYPKCSALMSKREALSFSKSVIVGAETSGARMCLQCSRSFCVNCKVPWHVNMTCFQYRRINPYAQPEDVKLKNLATQNMWRQCVKCNHMIELATGCYHITCRCGYEFCYTCGAEWRNKKPTCTCPIWDEDNIIEDEEENEEEEDFDDDHLF